ncbi:MAG TPA: FAD:protein FMN transferase [Candidatus Dormibacteraeota bacterium]|nr:FAD:protein FMN transferase [Candidatus Dormibacteraeota bacterium]
MRPDTVSRHFDAMDTACSLFAVDGDLAAAESWVSRMADRLTRFSRDSELSQLNWHAGAWCAVSDDLESVLRAALDAYAMSSGLVNAAVLPSMVAIGYTRSFADGHGIATLERARPLPPLPEVLQIRPGQAHVAHGAGIDLGGIAKGWMADRLSEKIGSYCVVNLGGDLRVRGQWPIGIGPATLMLHDQGAATSSVRKRRWADVHHLIDPRTGLPARTGLHDVSVVCPTALEAEVVAKTALLLGPERAPEYCAQHAMAWWLA